MEIYINIKTTHFIFQLIDLVGYQLRTKYNLRFEMIIYKYEYIFISHMFHPEVPFINQHIYTIQPIV